jgi:periplasmic nitrate reductase NapE
MASPTKPMAAQAEEPPTRRQELCMFALLAVLIWPFIAVGVVGGYGFLVWMWQLVFGPPGPPPG